jgi:hypothetical protein
MTALQKLESGKMQLYTDRMVVAAVVVVVVVERKE